MFLVFAQTNILCILNIIFYVFSFGNHTLNIFILRKLNFNFLFLIIVYFDRLWPNVYFPPTHYVRIKFN